MVLMFVLTRGLTMSQQYWVPGISVATLTLVLIFFMREPRLKLQGPENRSSEQNAAPSQQHLLQIITQEVWNECVQKPKYIFCFICFMVSRLISILFSVTIQLWIMSFQKSGVLATNEDSDLIYRNVIILSQGITLLTIPIFGFYSDRIDPRVIIPITFLIRGCIAASFKCIEDPRHWYGYTANVLIIIVSQIQFISVEVLFLRNMNGRIRGTLSGLGMFFGGLGSTAFTLIGGIVFDQVGPWAPFMLVAGADAAILIFSIFFIGCGLISKVD